MRHDPRDVRHGVMKYTVHDVDRVRVGRGTDRFHASALVHRHIHDDRALLHTGDRPAADQDGSPAARHHACVASRWWAPVWPETRPATSAMAGGMASPPAGRAPLWWGRATARRSSRASAKGRLAAGWR